MKITEKRTVGDLSVERVAEFDGHSPAEVELFRELRAWLTERVFAEWGPREQARS